MIFPHFLHRSLLLFAFLPLPAFAISNLILCVRICTRLHEQKCLLRDVCREWSRLHATLWSPLAPFPAPAELSLGQVSASITAQQAALRSRAEQTFPGSFGASRSVTSCTLLRSLMPPVTVFRDCITVSWDGELPAACNSLRTVSHWLSVNSNFVLSRQGTG